MSTAPPFDPELSAVLAAGPEGPTTLTPEMIQRLRPLLITPPATVLGPRPISYVDHVAPGPPGAPGVAITVLQRHDRKPGGPAVYYIHGGGMILGDRWFGIGPVLDWVEDLDALLVTVEYRLAPEHPFPAPLDDCHAGLLWLAEHCDDLAFDPTRLVLAGASAGGGLAAGLALKLRDHGGPSLAAQVLIYPMLDDRNASVSSCQFDGIGRWDRGSNNTGWDAYLGPLRMTEDVPIYAAPSRATDLFGLPRTFIDVGSAEVFRDEDVAYATQMWADGGDCELHVWPGGFHAFDMAAPSSRLAQAMVATRTRWLRHTLDRSS